MDGQLFETSLVSETQQNQTPKSSPKLPKALSYFEIPRSSDAAAILAIPLLSDGYYVSPKAQNDGKRYVFDVTSSDGRYKIHGKQLMQKHLQELKALAALRERNKALAFAKGAGNAVITPAKSVYNTVTSPVQAANNVVDKAKDTYSGAKRGVSKAVNFVRTKGDLPSETAEREEDGMISSFLGRPEMVRALATELNVDPYTHYQPLRAELKSVASYKTAGNFGVSTGIGFIPGVGGIVVSGITTTDSLTRKTLEQSAEDMARINRERLTAFGISKKTQEAFLLNSHYTPTEKTLFTGFVVQADGIKSMSDFMQHAGEVKSRSEAFDTLITAEMLSKLHERHTILKVLIKQDLVLAQHQDKQASLLLPYDQLSWTKGNAAQYWALSKDLKKDSSMSTKLSVLLAGGLTKKSKQAMLTLGWKARPDLIK
jgi:hypothetical protein